MPFGDFAGTERYRIVRRLGHGSMGVVYEAHDGVRRENVALKTFRTDDSDSLYRLKREFRRLVDLDHPNLVSLYDLNVTAEGSFFTMELVRGADFSVYCRRDSEYPPPLPNRTPVDTHLRYLAAQTSSLNGHHGTDTGRDIDVGPKSSNGATDHDVHVFGSLEDDAPTERVATPILACDEVRLRRVLPQLVEGVRALHLAGKLHRDIKPSNVLIDDRGQVKLLDFGLVVDMRSIEEESLKGGIVGTVAYMSPEQAAGEVELTPASDWYSVGVLVYGALTGKLPFGGEAWKMVLAKQDRPAPPPRQLVPEVPEDLDALCVRLLKRRPEDRPTAEEILERLGLGSTPPSLSSNTSSSSTAQRTQFTGRAAELSRLFAAFELVKAGRTGVVFVTGPSGMGKTALVREFVAQVRRQLDDMVLLEGRCFERETVPYQAMDDLVDDFSRVWHRMANDEAAALLPLDVTPLVRLFPVLGRVPAVAGAPAEMEVEDPQERRSRGFSALREVFLRLGRRQRIILFIDDMQWVDADTVTLLIDMLRPPEPPPLLLVLAARSDARPNPQLERLQSALGVIADHVPVARLSSSDAAELARRLLGPGQAGLAERIASEASGSPFFIAELVRYASTVRLGSMTAIAIDDVVRQRLEDLSTAARRLLELLALAGEPLSIDVATTAAGTPAATRDRTVRTLRQRSLIRKAQRGRRDGIEIYHDRFRQVIVAQLTRRAVSEHHRALAIALHQFEEGTAAQLARHWGAAGDRARAVEFTLKAAEQASNGLAFDRAAAFFTNALEIGDFDDEMRRQVQLALATTLARAARGPEAAQLFTEVAQGAPPATRLACEKRAAEQWLISGHIQPGLAAVRRLLAELGVKLPRSTWVAIASVVFNRLALHLGGYRWTERPLGELTDRVATRLDVYRSVGLGVALVDPLRAADFQGRLLRLSLRTGDPVHVARGLLSEANYRSTRGPKARPLVQRLLSEGRKVADRVGDNYLIAFTFGSEGFVHYYFSEFKQALEQLKRSDELFSEKTVEAIWERNTIRLVRLWALMRTARFGELRILFDKYVREAARGGDLYTETTLRRSCNRVWLADDNVDGARADLARTTWSPPEGRVHLQHWYSIRSTSELALYEGRTGMLEIHRNGFRALERSMMTRVQIIRTEAQWLQARLLLSEQRDPRQVERIGQRLRKEGAGYARVWGLLSSAAAAQQRGHGDRAANFLREAVTVGAEQNMHLCAQTALHRLGALLGGNIGAQMVSDAERHLRHMGVRNPSAMMNVIAPGFTGSDSAGG